MHTTSQLKNNLSKYFFYSRNITALDAKELYPQYRTLKLQRRRNIQHNSPVYLYHANPINEYQ